MNCKQRRAHYFYASHVRLKNSKVFNIRQRKRLAVRNQRIDMLNAASRSRNSTARARPMYAALSNILVHTPPRQGSLRKCF